MKKILVIGGNSKLAKIFIRGQKVNETLKVTTKQALNLEKESSIKDFIKKNKNIFDAVIFFASIYEKMSSFVDIRNIERHLLINVINPLRLLKGLNLNKSARIIFFVDSGIIQPKPGFLGYSFSKAVLQELIRELAVEFAPNKTVVGLSLGPTISSKKSREAKRKYHKRSLIKVEHPEQGVVNLVRFLIHEENLYMSGCIIPYNGGTYIKRS